MSGPTVVVLDYGSGNVHSAAKAIEAVGGRVSLTADPTRVADAHGLLVPGVGAFPAVMEALRSVRGAELIDRRLAGGRAVLGICVGMQVMFEHGVEHGVDRESQTEGLGQWPGSVTKLASPILPHIGWNTVQSPPDSMLFAGVAHERFYFVHSFAAKSWDLPDDARRVSPHLTWATHGQRFLAAVENGPLTTTQFHPEKSGPAGLRLLANWVESLQPD